MAHHQLYMIQYLQIIKQKLVALYLSEYQINSPQKLNNVFQGNQQIFGEQMQQYIPDNFTFRKIPLNEEKNQIKVLDDSKCFIKGRQIINEQKGEFQSNFTSFTEVQFNTTSQDYNLDQMVTFDYYYSSIGNLQLEINCESIKIPIFSQLVKMKVDMRNTNFENIKIQNTSFVGSNFARCKFSGSQFENVDISGINLNGVILFNCKLRNMKMQKLNKLDGHTSRSIQYVSLLMVIHQHLVVMITLFISVMLKLDNKNQKDGQTSYVKSVCFSPLS